MDLLIYSFLFAILLFALCKETACLGDSINEKAYRNNKITIVLLIIMALYVLIRTFAYNTGSDYMLYYQYYLSEAHGVQYWWAEDREKGFRFLVKTLSSVSDMPQVFFMVCAILGLGSVVLVSRKFSKASPYIVFAWIVFMFNQSNNLYRQYLAFACLLLAYYFFLSKKYKIFILICTLACLFHKSALIGIFILSLIYLVRKIQINKWIFIGLILVTTIGADAVFNTALNQLGFYIDLVMNSLGKSYYAETMEDSVFDKGQMAYPIMVANIIIIWYSDRVLKSDDTYRFLYYVMAVSFILDPISRQEILMRMRFYTLNFMIIAYGLNLFLNKKNMLKKPLLIMAVAFHFSYYYIYVNGALFVNNPLIFQF